MLKVYGVWSNEPGTCFLRDDDGRVVEILSKNKTEAIEHAAKRYGASGVTFLRFVDL